MFGEKFKRKYDYNIIKNYFKLKKSKTPEIII